MKIEAEGALKEKSVFSEGFAEADQKYKLWGKIHNYELRPKST